MAKRGPKKAGEPPLIEPAKIKALMRVSPTLEDTAAFFECSTDTVERFIKKNWGLGFAEFRLQNAVSTRLDLRRVAIQKALKGDNTMLIWCTKNLCGWRDKYDIANDKPQREETKSLTSAERKTRLKELQDKKKDLGDD